jgi:toxin ParE1/3/4
MLRPVTNFRLTFAALADFESIARYTQDTWGTEQRRAYLADLDAAFYRLADSEHLGRPQNIIRQGLFRYNCGQHAIFFRRHNHTVEILRILHGRQSPERAFKS